MSSSTEDLRVELGYLRDTVVEAATHRRSGIVESGLETYRVLVETFIDVLKQFDAVYGREQALAEMNSLGGGWSEIEWVRDDYREIADASLASRNLSVLLPVLRFPVGLSELAFKKGDYFIFAQFLNWLPYLYESSVEQLAASSDADDRLMEIVRSRVATYARELVEYYINPRIEDAEEGESVVRDCDFVRGAFAVFNRLLKNAYDLRRVQDFSHFASELQDVRLPEDHVAAASFADLQTAASRAASPAPASANEARGYCYARLASFRKIIFLGLEAWMLRDHKNGNLSGQETRDLRSSMPLPSSIQELWTLWVEAREERYENELEWSWWQSREHRGRGSYTGIDFGMLLLTPVLLRMLITASSMSEEQVLGLRLPLVSDLDHLVGNGSGPLVQMLDHVAASSELRELAGFQPEVALWLRTRFLALAEEQADEELQRVIAAPLSPKRVSELKENILRGWREGGYLRELVRHRGRYEEAEDPPAELGALSVHILERKDVLIEQSRFASNGWGVEYGRSLAQGEDDFFIEKIVTAAPTLSVQPVPAAELIGHLDAALAASDDIPSPLIVLVGSLGAGWALADSGRFRYSQRALSRERDGREPQPSGYFGDVPTYQIHSQTRSVAIVADLQRLGVWRQYIPSARSSLSEYVARVLLFELESYTRPQAEALIASQPDTFRLSEGSSVPSERSVEERVALVLQRVRLLVLEQFEFVISTPTAARVFALSNDE